MSKKNKKTVFFCSECGYESIKWLGQCPVCGAWNSFTETESIESIVSNESKTSNSKNIKKIDLKTLDDITYTKEDRIESGISEFDNLLGGGVVRGSLLLLGGAPGIGKSTLLLQVVKAYADRGLNVIYVSGEESLQQIKIRALRIGKFNDNVKFISDTDMDAIFSVVIKNKPDILIIDSIQTMALNIEDKIPGSITQVRACTQGLFRLCKEQNISAFIVGHITKEGTVAGPKLLEHIVDLSLIHI